MLSFWIFIPFLVQIEALKRIIGGESADITQFPYQVMVIWEEDSVLTICGGALVTKNKVVTAAHCVKDSNIDNLKVIAGVTQPDSLHKHQVESYYVHPKYRKSKVGNDIAVICLEYSLKETEWIKHINIAKKQVKKGTKAVVSGWGKTEDEFVSKELKYANVTVIDGARCKQENSLFDETQICTDSDGVGPCKGDSGGPLVANKELIGIVSYGNVDCQANYVRMYTNVYHYKSFIEQHKC